MKRQHMREAERYEAAKRPGCVQIEFLKVGRSRNPEKTCIPYSGVWTSTCRLWESLKV